MWTETEKLKNKILKNTEKYKEREKENENRISQNNYENEKLHFVFFTFGILF